jgi:hypothetical protein
VEIVPAPFGDEEKIHPQPAHFHHPAAAKQAFNAFFRLARFLITEGNKTHRR